MRKRVLLSLSLLALVAILPFADHADQVTCSNCTTSLASTINNPVAGDEAFFKLPSGPSNVMFLLDTSGSMSEFPQCSDYNWDATSAPSTCKSPNTGAWASSGASALPNPTSYTTSPTYTLTGTCTPATDGLTSSNSNLAWMEAVTPQTAYADPGRTNSLLADCPPWGNGGPGCGTKVCSGSGCLFAPDAYYLYGDWQPNGGGTGSWYPTTTQRAFDTPTGTQAGACIALDASGNVIKDYKSGLPVSLGAACTTCMANHGFYIYKINYYDSSRNVRSVTQPIFKGTFLNANPPKFVTAKKVLKDIAWMDPAAPSVLDQIRLGLSILDSGGSSPRKARLIVPLGPDKAASYPPTQAGFRQSRQYILSVLNYDTSRYTDAAGNVIVDGTTTGTSGFQNGFFNPASGSTPLASALFNVGQYFTAVTPSLYSNVFGATGCGGGSCTTTEFNETAAGRTNAAWVTRTGNTQCSVCWGCQASSIIVVTDGSPNSEITLPTLLKTYDNNGYGLSTNCAGTYSAGTTVPSTDTTFRCESPSDGTASGLPRVADWLHNQAATGRLAPAGLRYDLVLGGGQKAVTVDTIGIAITDVSARRILRATANLSGGIYQNAKDPATLAQAVYNSVTRVAPKAISFSSASSNSLQTVQTSASQAFITRFRPNEQNAWEGHVIEAFLFDEFLNGCDPKKPTQPTVSCGQTTVKTVSADFNGDGSCDGVFMIDLDCDEIIEDTSTGNFLKKGTTRAAKLPWDAGQVLSYETYPSPGPPTPGTNTAYRSADESASNARQIFTWIGGRRVNFTTANAATIQPYLNISASWCTSFLAQIGVSGGTNPTLECAKEIIHYVRGWDVLDQDSDGCAGPGKTNATTCQRGTKGEERDRLMDATYSSTTGSGYFWKLGDISHSSPAVLQAPVDEIRCDTGYEKQCTWAIHSPTGIPNQTPMDSSCTRHDCYQDYRTANIARQRVVLVGANDGMLHAFDAGAAQTSNTPDITGSYPYSNGTGAELWAFIPPDLLPRLKDLMTAHQYMVDGSVMLRDVWVDGTSAADGLSTPAAPTGADGTKQTGEFHTIAVFGRRAGGNQYTALDVTDPSKPTFLWNFPPGGSDDSRYMAQSWTDFAPLPPPIVPIKLAARDTSPAPDRTRGFSERWVVMFGGGYDPALTRGRAVFFVDVWTGATVWRFTDDDFKANLGFTGSAAPSMFPVAGGVGPVDIGDPNAPVLDVDGFFDTATWGDLGGNVFVARFHTPGVIDRTTGRVNNWFAARAFEQLRRTDNAQYVSASGAGRNEFFHMTANAYEPLTRTLRTFIGTGNREQLMKTSATCGPDNLLGCCQGGCTNVTATTTENFGTCARSDTFSCVNGLLTHTTSNSCSASGATCSAYSESVNLSFTCPGGTATAMSGQATMDGSGLGTVAPVGPATIAATLTAPTHNRFYGFRSYGGATTRTFTDAASAKTFDDNRLTDASYVGTCDGGGTGSCTLLNTTQASVAFDKALTQNTTVTCPSGTRCTATVNDPGWYYEYGDVCPLASCASAPPWTDEKTASGSNVILGCVYFEGFRPFGVSTSTDPCSGTQGVPTVYDYAVNYISGTPTAACSGDTDTSGTTGAAYFAAQRSVTAAPSGPMVIVDVVPGGSSSHPGGSSTGGGPVAKVNYKAGHIGDSGSTSSAQSAGTVTTGGSRLYWLTVPQQLHECRHVDSASCK